MLAGGALAGATYLMTRGARAETPALRPTAGSPPGGGLDISGTTAVVAGVTAGAGYAGYRMLTRGASAAPAAAPAIAAAPGRLARVGGLLRRAAFPLTVLAAANEAARGFNAAGPAGALRGAGNVLTFGALDMAIGAAPARPATANSSAHTAAVAGASGASVNASAAIAQASQGSTTAMPGVAVSSDGMTAGYSRNRRLASGITVHEQVSSYTTPVRR